MHFRAWLQAYSTVHNTLIGLINMADHQTGTIGLRQCKISSAHKKVKCELKIHYFLIGMLITTQLNRFLDNIQS